MLKPNLKSGQGSIVMPAKAGVQSPHVNLDASLRWHDTLLTLFSVLVATFMSSCVEFNTCEIKSSPLIGEIAMEFDVRQSTVRTRGCPIGNLVADSIFWFAKKECQHDDGPWCPDLALINAGAIREETACGTRKTILAGPIHLFDIEQLLPFANELVVVRLTGNDIKLALEHSVSELGRALPDATSPHFLQVAGISFDVDCKNAPLSQTSDGLRVARMGRRVSNIQLTSQKANVPLELNRYYNVAMTNYLAEGNDGFLAFLQRDHDNTVLLGTNRQPLTKFNPKTDTVLGSSDKSVFYRQTVTDWIALQHRHSRPVAADTGERIHINVNCNTL